MPTSRLLLEGEKQVPLGSRAIDILTALIDRAGEVVTKEELAAIAWPGILVEESNLRVHIAGIRRVLGDGRAGSRYVTTVPGRGYCFVAPIDRRSSVAPAETAPAANISDLPQRLTRVIGRSELIARLSAQLPQRRFLTLVGAAGIGKTTVALAVARELASSYANGAIFVDLTPVNDPRLVPSALAAALGLAIPSADEVASLLAFLRDKNALLVIDSCEHVIDVAAAIAEGIYRHAPGVHILATSREPLRSEGERVQRLPPLETPPDFASLNAADAMGYGGVELFVERAAANVDGFALTDADASVVAEICRRLDGIALAIELAASRVDAFGLHELSARLDDRFRLLTSGRRTALPRHRTLAAALDWSYRLLPDAESAVLRRLAVFMGGFDAEAAAAVAAGSDDAPVITILANLIDKSLVAADLSGEIVLHRLLNTMRLYALDRLKESGELEESRRRHAAYHRDLFARARGEWETQPTALWLAAYGHRLDDLRAVLDWAFSLVGDEALGVALTADSVPLWLQLSLVRECRQRVETALAHVGAPTKDNARFRMRLSTARSLSRMYTGDTVAAVDAGWSETLALAEQVGDPDYQLRAIWGLFAGSFNAGDYRMALAFARRFREVAAQPAERLIGDRLIGTALHLLGDQQGARQHIEPMMAAYVAPPHSSHIIRYQNDQVVAARRVLAPVLWLQGYPDQAMRMAAEAVRDAVALGHALTLCNMLAQAACPLALLTGDLAAADGFTTMLMEQSARYSLNVWQAYGRCFQGISAIRRGDVDRGLAVLIAAGDDLSRAGFMQYHTPFLSALAEGYARAGATEPGLAAIETALARVEDTDERWCLAELLRLKGELLLQRGTDQAVELGERQFRQSLDLADGQHALSWQLRSATSLARLLRGQRRVEEARGLLRTVYERFSEGFETQDLQAARQLLTDLD